MKKSVSDVSTNKIQEMSDFFDDPNEIKETEDWLGHYPESYLIIGHPGSGKSTLAASWPDTYFISADNKMAGLPERSRRKMKTFKHGDAVYAESMEILTKLEKITPKELGIKTLIYDTLTAFSEMMEVEILADENLNEGKKQALQIQHYNIIGLRIQNLIRKCKEVGVDLIVITHMEESMAEDGTSVWLPSVTGKKQGAKLGGKFDHVIYMTPNSKGEYVARLKPSSAYPQAKIGVSVSINRTAPGIVKDLSYAKLQKILSGEMKKAEKKPTGKK